MADRDIPEETVEKAARAAFDAMKNGVFAGWSFDDLEVHHQEHWRTTARSALSAALAGRQVVDLPVPDGADEGGTLWEHDHGAVIADEYSTAETARIMRRRAGALLAAAVHIERNLAARSGSGED